MPVDIKASKELRLGSVRYHSYHRENEQGNQSYYRFFTIESSKPRTHFSANALNDFIADLQKFVVECGKLEKEGESNEASKV